MPANGASAVSHVKKRHNRCTTLVVNACGEANAEMGNVTQLDDIEEFSLVRRVPRAAITDEVLNGVRQLHETEHIEPFLRLILSDTTETPHGSTEIADILTTQVTYGGQPQLAAFVNKGRSTPRVRSGNVAHQVVRLGRLPRIDLMVLLAVGEIQDDIKADLLQVSRDAGAKYMIVDARDVARLFIAYQKVCPKDGTPFNDGQCPTCGTSADEPVELTLKLHEELRYEFLPHNDVSHAGAKRYRANVLTTDPHYAKSALREVVKEATWALRQSDYYRSPITEGYFGQQEADCVFLFVYLDLRDVQQTNWICRTQWIRPDLPQQFKPLEWHGDERLGDIEIDWNEHYETRRSLFPHGTKQEWVRKAESLIPQMDTRVAQATDAFNARLAGELDDAEFDQIMTRLESEARDIVREGGNKKIPPVECNEANKAFQGLLTMFHNIFVPFASWSRVQRDWRFKEWHVRTYLSHYDEERQGFLYELKKVR